MSLICLTCRMFSDNVDLETRECKRCAKEKAKIRSAQKFGLEDLVSLRDFAREFIKETPSTVTIPGLDRALTPEEIRMVAFYEASARILQSKKMMELGPTEKIIDLIIPDSEPQTEE